MTESIAALVALGACLPALARWLRVAQREHYYSGSIARFAGRWWTSTPLDRGLAVLAITGAVASLVGLLVGALAATVGSAAVIVSGVAVVAGPSGLSVRGRTSPLVWTRRMRLLGGTCVALDALIAALGGALALTTGRPILFATVAAAAAIAQPFVVEAALRITAPVERRASQRFVALASARLHEAAPTIVAITGSYGKTTTKGYVRHLLTTSRRVLASPASFNNTGGLARTVNEQLTPGTQVFIAEMGTFGPGEIADLCAWIKPDIGVITAIGPVHLERMGSLETIVRAKSEILAEARIAVLNVDAYGLAAVATEFARRGRVIRCSTSDQAADVWAAIQGTELVVCVGGHEIVRVPGSNALPGNVACAVGVAVALDAPLDAVAAQLPTLPTAEHRQQIATSVAGVTVIDDTYNANPAGAAAALRLLARQGPAGRRVVVTPGMVELGPLQYQENATFARAAATGVASDIVVVARTNRKALLEGARGGAAQVRSVGRREDAVAWVRSTLRAGDAVLYENDLPDHYP